MSVEAGHSSPTGRLVVAASKDRVVFAAGKDGSSARTAVTTDFPVFQSAISPGEDLVALRGWANDVLLVNLGDNEAPPRRLIHDGQVLFVAFLRGGSVAQGPGVFRGDKEGGRAASSKRSSRNGARTAAFSPLRTSWLDKMSLYVDNTGRQTTRHCPEVLSHSCFYGWHPASKC